MEKGKKAGGLRSISEWCGVEAEWPPQFQIFQETPFYIATVGMGFTV